MPFELAMTLRRLCTDLRRRPKKLRKLAAAEVVVVSYSSCGRTWLNAMVSHYFHLKYGTPPDLLLNGDNLYAHDPRVPNLFHTHGTEIHGRGTRGLEMRGKDLSPLFAGKKAIFLYRDPRDVAVSWFFHVVKRKNAMGKQDVPGFADASMPLTLAFMLHEGKGLPYIIRFMNAWAAQFRRFEKTLTVAYEQMLAEPSRVLGEVVGFIDGAGDAALVERAVAFASFGNLRELETRGYFRSSRFGGGEPGDSNSLKVRRGKVGAWREHFTSDEARMIDDYVEARLSPDFPYDRAGFGEIP